MEAINTEEAVRHDPAVRNVQCIATRETPSIVIDSSCVNFRAISFATPSKTKPEAAANSYGTPETVDEIMAHNAKWNLLCCLPVKKRQ
jgi:hypothetical protein